MIDVMQLSARFGVNAERGEGGDFPVFLRRVKGKRVLLLADANTRPLAEPIAAALQKNGNALDFCALPEREPVADERTVAKVCAAGEGCGYLLAVGAGTLNDLAKRAGFLLGKPSGVYATAPSMDGFTSGVTPLIEGGFKVTRPAQVASDVLIDLSLLSSAPRIMIGAGVGDVLAKYCCLADWRISARLTGEKYNEEAASVMGEAVKACAESVPSLAEGNGAGVGKLMDALLVSGYAMVIAGSSRPASGAEHHMSHYLEMDYLRRGEKIPLHGVKVGLGTLVSLYLYHTVSSRPAFEGCEFVRREAEKLPPVEYVERALASLGCPTKFSQLGLARETVRRMLFEAYKVRDRFTVLTLYCTKGFMERASEEALERFY